jgi:hypothetical protein
MSWTNRTVLKTSLATSLAVVATGSRDWQLRLQLDWYPRSDCL